jgi:DNA gyrase/topoisomerase IV subunit A
MIAMMEVTDKDELVIISTKGMVIRQSVKDIRVMGRNTQGVRVIRLKEGDSIADIARVVTEEMLMKRHQRRNPDLSKFFIYNKYLRRLNFFSAVFF